LSAVVFSLTVRQAAVLRALADGRAIDPAVPALAALVRRGLVTPDLRLTDLGTAAAALAALLIDSEGASG
jgi:hypothetical protein